MCKLSIIVPVYNVEKYIEKCIKSLINQNLEDVEIIMVDDGSEDLSASIIKKYQEKHESIKYYKKENGGLSDARNYGISKAIGKYIMFVDSDDYIKEGLIEKLQEYIMQDVELIKFKLEKIDEDGVVIEKIDGATFNKVTGEEAFNLLAFSDVLLDSACVYCFKKSLFGDNNLKFKVNTEHEDFGLIPLLILKAKSVVSINEYGYCYIQSKQSITRNEDYKRTLKRFDDALAHYDNMIKFIENEDISITTKKNIKTYYTNAIILKLNELKSKDQKIYIHKIQQRKMLKNIQVHNIKQLIKKMILKINIKLYVKMKI